MSLTNTNIQFQRSINSIDALQEKEDELKLNFGEPFFIDNIEKFDSNGYLTEPVNAYLAIGRKPKDIDGEVDAVSFKKSPVIKALSFDKSNKLVFYNDRGQIIDEANNPLPADRLTTKSIITSSLQDGSDKYYILCQKDDDNDPLIYKFKLDDFGIFVNNRGIMHGAAWNDYAEYREIEGKALPGQVVCDTGKGTVKLSEKRLQPCAHVVSDTYGHIIGKKDNSVPIAVAGRVLVNIDSNIGNIQLGDCVCAGPYGFAYKMTNQEITTCPDRILGVVCEILDVDDTNNIQKVWINIK